MVRAPCHVAKSSFSKPLGMNALPLGLAGCLWYLWSQVGQRALTFRRKLVSLNISKFTLYACFFHVPSSIEIIPSLSSSNVYLDLILFDFYSFELIPSNILGEECCLNTAVLA